MPDKKKRIVKPAPKAAPKKGFDIGGFIKDVGTQQLIASGLDTVNNYADKALKFAGKSKGILETGYDIYNVIKSLNEGNAPKASANTLGALLPGISGKSIEAGLERILPKELLNPDEETKFRMKSVLLDGYRGDYDKLGEIYKKKKAKGEKFMVGGKVNNYVQDPSTVLAKLQIDLSKAKQESMNDPLANIFDGLSALAPMIMGNLGTGSSAPTTQTVATGGIIEGDPPVKKKLSKDYSKNPYYKDREDWGEKLDYKFPNGKRPVRDIINSAAKQMGIDPGLLYTSSMEEGMKLALQGKDTGERRSGYKELIKKNPKAAKEYPVDGGYFYGLNTFGDKYGKLIKPSSFPAGYKFQSYPQTNSETGEVFYNSAAFKSHDDAIMAKAGMMRQVEDAMQARYKKNNINLDPEAQKFFSMVGYNMGEDKTIEMIKSFEKKGYLKDNKFLDPNFQPASWKEPYTNVQRRYQNYKILNDEGYFSEKHKVGGNVRRPNIEIERGEILERPDGTILDFKDVGKKHKSGGIKLDNQIAPAGTEVHSAEVKINGKTMADIKRKYESKLDKITKLLAENPTDKVLANTKTLFEQGYKKVNDRNMMIQNIIKESNQKMATGGTIDDLSEEEMYEVESYANENDVSLEEAYDMLYGDAGYAQEDEFAESEDDMYVEDEEYMEEEEDEEENEDPEDYFAEGGTRKPKKSWELIKDAFVAGMPEPTFIGDEGLDNDIINKYPTRLSYAAYDKIPITADQSTDGISIAPEKTSLNILGGKSNTEEGYARSGLENILGNYSIGDITGMLGSAFGATAGLRNTEANRAGDTPNINPYANYGDEAMKTLDRASEGLEINRDLALKNSQLNRNAAQARGRNSSRSINMSRAMDLSADQIANKQENDIYANSANMIANLFNTKANAQFKQDQMKMQGNSMRDLNDRRDRDSYYSQRGQDLQSIATGIQQFGKQLNTGVERDMQADLLSSLSEYFGMDITADGITIGNKKKGKKK